jgi:uncharacterized lipoprotein YddW (UPF0748 family)
MLAVLLGFCAIAVHLSALAGPHPRSVRPDSLRSLAAAAGAPSRAATVQEVRALWVLRTSLSSPAAVQQLVQSARDNGFNVLLVQVRGRGDAYYQSNLEPRAADLSKQPDTFDPLASVIEAARPAGLQVHAWVNVNFVSSAADLPGAREHIIHRHPEWLMVPRDLAQDLARVDPESPAYVGKLARWTRAQSAGIEGLYSSPLVPAAVEHTVAVIRDIAKHYRIDGVHLDYIRYPSDRFDYSRAAVRAFAATIQPKLTAAVRSHLDSLERDDLFAYTDAFPGEWRQFRVNRLTALVRRLREVVKAERQDASVTVATAPDLQEARDGRLQDWGAWLENGLVDAICPMAYTPEAARFAEHIAAARQVAGERPIWAGIGAYRLTPTQTIENIQAARKLGASGIVLFSYDSMTDPRQSTPDYLAIVSRAAFGRRIAATGSR